jgi:glycosyltransferase involved in cell wall biosynthesis
MARPRLLHLHSTFNLGGKEARCVQLINAFGECWEHEIVSGMPDQTGAMALIDPARPARLRSDFPLLTGPLGLARLRDIGRAIAAGGYDLVLTYNFGSLDGALANRLHAAVPHIHHEDGFNEDEAVRQKPLRVLFRRAAIASAHRLVVPSRNLERIAREVWKQPAGRVACVPNGVDMALYDTPPAADAIPGFVRREGEVVVGTLAGLRTVKNLPRLVRAFAAAARAVPDVPSRLVIVGRGPEEAAIRAAGEAEGLGDRLVMPGFLAHPHRYVGLFDVFALSSDSEQFPISLVEAMAAGLPAASTDVGDVRDILSEPNRALIGDEAALASALTRLIAEPGLRAELGACNRARVASEYSAARMIDTYRAIYEAAMNGKRER